MPGDPATQRAQARVGTSLEGRWRVERILGVGGMATVYEAVHRNGNRVAIKVLHPELSVDPDLAQRFAQEGYVANHVGHEGTVRVLDDGVTPDDAPFLVMELLAGETLEDRRLRCGETLPLVEVVHLGVQLLEVMAAAHGAGVIHRDLKPENLFLTTGGVLKVLDFGVARLGEQSQTVGRTRSGSILGTPAFMAPEQARGRWEEVGERTDVWAIGATLFTLLSGRFVHEAETANEQLILAATHPAAPVRSVARDVPEPIAAIVDRALAHDPDARYQTATEMLDELRPHRGEALPDSFGRAREVAAVSIAETLAAPSHPDHGMPSRPGISGSSRAGLAGASRPGLSASSTARPSTRTASSVAAPRKRYAAFAMACAGAGGVGLAAWMVSREPEPAEDGAPVSAPTPTSTQTPLPGTPSVVTRTPAPPETTPTASVTLPAPRPSASAAPAPRPRSIVRRSAAASDDDVADPLLDRRR